MPHSPEQTAEILAEASGHYAARDLPAAADAVARGLALRPDLPALWEVKGAIALASGHPDDAADALGRAADLAQAGLGYEAVGLRLNHATALERAGRVDAALAALGAARAALVPILTRHATAEARAAATGQIASIDLRAARLLWPAGRHDEAIAAMVRAADGAPDSPATLDQLASALAWTLRLVEGIAVSLHLAMRDPAAAEPARNVGQFLARLGAHDAAGAWFRAALARDPSDAEAQAALAAGLADAVPAAMDPTTAALIDAVAAIARTPTDVSAHVALAQRLLAGGQEPLGARPADWPLLARGAAAAVLRRALAIDPAQPVAALLLAGCLSARHDDDQAAAVLRTALKLAPGDPRMHASLGDALRVQWRLDEAARSYRAALALEPDSAQVLVNLATTLANAGPSEEAVALLRRALELEPASAEIRGDLGVAQSRLRQLAAGLENLRLVLAARPNEPNWHFAAAAAHLALGDYDQGWPEYAWRWRLDERVGTSRAPDDPFRRPQPAAWRGKTVLLYAEQGHGDTIQFLRYTRLVMECGARVLLEVQPALKTLAEGIPGVSGVHAQGEMAPAHDEAVPLLHLPWAFGTTLATIPATIPYLRPDLTRAAAWRRRVQGLPGLKVGLVWSGDPRPHSPIQSFMDRRRSLSLAALAPLAAIPGLIFVSLQKGAPAEQAATPPPGMVLHDWTGELGDFAETAALMSALDLIISVDTAPLHLAGALGRETWLLNRVDSDWRWLAERDDSPWYPTLRQFRQARPGDWDEVVARVAAALRERGR